MPQNFSLDQPVRALVGEVQQARLRARDLAEVSLGRANGNNSRNTYLSLRPETVRRQADLCQPSSDLHLCGLPISVKDCFDVEGHLTCLGLKGYETQPAQENSVVVERIIRAGALVTGKTHMNQLAYGLTGENADFGDCLQPGKSNLLTGGSSSGAASSILEGSAAVGIGTDTGGSIRFPASLAGLAGYRATLGLGSWQGAYHLAGSFDSLGILFRYLKDGPYLAAAILGVTAGNQSRVASRYPVRIGWVEQSFCGDAEPAVWSELVNWSERFIKAGCDVETFEPPEWDQALSIFRPLQAYEAARLHEALRPICEPSVVARLAYGASLDEAEIEHWRQEKAQFCTRTLELFQRFDYLLLPCAPVSALRAGEEHGPVRDRILRYTTPASVAGLPVVALPQPVGGAQLIGAPWSDARLLAFAAGL